MHTHTYLHTYIQYWTVSVVLGSVDEAAEGAISASFQPHEHELQPEPVETTPIEAIRPNGLLSRMGAVLQKESVTSVSDKSDEGDP